MPNVLRPALVLALTAMLSGCLAGGTSRLAPASQGVVALGDGLVGQSKVRLPADVRAKALEAEFQALQFAPAGTPVDWTEDRYQGSVVPTQLYRIGEKDCRGYAHTLIAKGDSSKTVGTACRGEDGLWRPVV